MNQENLSKVILNFIHRETGWGDPLRPHCEFEELTLVEIIELDNNSSKVMFKYIFDEDGFSQYDKTHVFEGIVIVSSSDEIMFTQFKEIHAGQATALSYKPKEENI